MSKEEIKHQIEKISKDSSISLDERIEIIFKMREERTWDHETDIECFRSLIAAIKDEDAIATHVGALLQLSVLLAETLAENDIYRPLENLSIEVRAVLRDNRIAWDVVEDTIPRFIDALEDSVYHFETYRLILVYLDKALRNGKLDKNLKGYARHLLKLRIHLDESYFWHDHLLGKEMQAAIAALFTPDELLKIIVNPTIGHLKCDPVEYTRRWEEIYYDVEDYLNERFANVPRQMGFCFRYWSAKREYLKDNYNIDWQSPSQMNPDVIFD